MGDLSTKSRQAVPESQDSKALWDGPVLAVVGPTASGKSSLAMFLAESFNGEIINTDSMQVYRHFNIGTAKPSREDRERVPHHLIDQVEPEETYSAQRYVEDAERAIGGIVQRGGLPILCGGTGLYFRALLFGLVDMPEVPAEIRSKLEVRLKVQGSAALHDELATVDPDSAAAVHPNDPVRILRALEVYQATGRPLSEFRQRQPFRSRGHQVLTLGVQWDRPELYRRINARVDQMFKVNWVGEVEDLLARGYGAHLTPMQAIGYREIADWLTECPREHRGHPDALEKLEILKKTIAMRTRRYAKRQITWFKQQPDIRWGPPGQSAAFAKDVEAFLGTSPQRTSIESAM